MGRRYRQTFLQKRHAHGQEACEKMLSIFRQTIRGMQVKTAMRHHTVQNSHHLNIYKQ